MDKPFVLIIEDERDIAALFRHVMDLAGYRTEIAANGKVAVERLTRSQPDIVLLDLTLPGIPGSDILNMMRKEERLKNIPVVVVTAYSEIAESLPIEPDLVMLKPVSADQLTHLVQRLRRNSRTVDATPFGKTPWDKITGLYNRPFFANRLDYALKSLEENAQSLFAVILVGVQGEEGTEGESGKKHTEQSLREIAKLLKASVRPTDTIAKFDQDHFFILIEAVPNGDIPALIAARIQEKLKESAEDDSAEPFQCSISVLLCDDRYVDVNEILRDLKTVYSSAFARGQTGTFTFDHATVEKLGKPRPQ